MREKNLVLGVDPGSSRTGFGLILSDNENFKLLDYGTISTSKNDKLPQKLKRIYQGLLRIIREKKPDALVVEDAFYKKNGEEDTDRCQGRSGYGHSHLRGTIDGTFLGAFPYFTMTRNVFKDHDGIINDHSNGDDHSE